MAWPKRNGRTWSQAVPGFEDEITFTEDVDVLDLMAVAMAITGTQTADPQALGRLMSRAVQSPPLGAGDFQQMPLAHQLALVNAYFEKVNIGSILAHGKA